MTNTAEWRIIETPENKQLMNELNKLWLSLFCGKLVTIKRLKLSLKDYDLYIGRYPDFQAGKVKYITADVVCEVD